MEFIPVKNPLTKSSGHKTLIFMEAEPDTQATSLLYVSKLYKIPATSLCLNV
ncbi:hypothetical protein MADA3029_910087 [Vibrio nigripulchritudo MADA3029]|nr:hypothetical protein VIBNIMADA3020_810088 [Vibrio nigripulchritudo MADA3020]CCN56421.1 hypothetical protein VIBNIMADA3021_950031 [Vibrio nigripulchritudo MADA3021]CCN62086.1 hypothetical protein MADA3029_910087 [Vibrio nigripulchritudo MADA3029]